MACHSNQAVIIVNSATCSDHISFGHPAFQIHSNNIDVGECEFSMDWAIYNVIADKNLQQV